MWWFLPAMQVSFPDDRLPPESARDSLNSWNKTHSDQQPSRLDPWMSGLQCSRIVTRMSLSSIWINYHQTKRMLKRQNRGWLQMIKIVSVQTLQLLQLSVILLRFCSVVLYWLVFLLCSFLLRVWFSCCCCSSNWAMIRIIVVSMAQTYSECQTSCSFPLTLRS